MKNIIPYEKDIDFPTKIAEITSISLEHEEEIKDDEINGYFIVSGDYKIHSISVNKEDFEYKIPFTIALNDLIDKDSIKIDISDFTYDIKENDILTVKIDLDFSFEEIKQEELRIDDIKIDEEINNIDSDNIKVIEEEKDSVDILSDKTKNASDTYVLYHIHIINETDTIDLLCQKYNITKDIIYEYNDFEDIKIGDKLLIPLNNNE